LRTLIDDYLCRPGEVFVHRNVGALVPGNDLNALSVLEYAVEHLKVTDIIVTGMFLILYHIGCETDSPDWYNDVNSGHYDCGAVRAATKRQDLGLLENWLRHIRDVYRIHKDYLDMISVRTVTLFPLVRS
jgi:carbonic anhydrase